MKRLPPFLKWPASDVFKEKIQAAFSSSVEKELVIVFGSYAPQRETTLSDVDVAACQIMSP
jgi:predicted nucleotidyltransferase